MERAHALTELVRAVSQARDRLGMLSITVGVEPGTASGGSPPWEISVEDDLTRLARDPSLGPVLARRLEETSTRLAELLDPTRSGWGCAPYVGLGSGESHEVTLQRLLPVPASARPRTCSPCSASRAFGPRMRSGGSKATRPSRSPRPRE